MSRGLVVVVGNVVVTKLSKKRILHYMKNQYIFKHFEHKTSVNHRLKIYNNTEYNRSLSGLFCIIKKCTCSHFLDSSLHLIPRNIFFLSLS